MLREADGAFVGRLVAVRAVGDGPKADFIYRVGRVYKRGPGLRRGRRVSVRSIRFEVTCGLQSTKGELYALFVHPDHWGVGAGRALADAACADLRAAGCTTVNLWVLEANTRARRFYAKYGFEDTGDRGRSSLNELPEIRLSLSRRPS